VILYLSIIAISFHFVTKEEKKKKKSHVEEKESKN